MSISPKQISESLGVPPSTIRRWSSRFVAYLTPQPAEAGRHRVYSHLDLETFRRIRDLTAQGQSLGAIENDLKVVDRPAQAEADQAEAPNVDTPQTNPGTALAIVGMSNQLGAHNEKLESLQSQIDLANKRLAQLTEYLALPWWKRLGKRPPIVY